LVKWLTDVWLVHSKAEVRLDLLLVNKTRAEQLRGLSDIYQPS
jgi:hypothetical protein